MESHYRHVPVHHRLSETPAATPWTDDTVLAGDYLDNKFHQPHAPATFKGRMLSLWWNVKQIKHLPLPAVFVLCFLAFYAGTAFQTATELPTPGGPQVCNAIQLYTVQYRTVSMV